MTHSTNVDESPSSDALGAPTLEITACVGAKAVNRATVLDKVDTISTCIDSETFQAEMPIDTTVNEV